MYTELSIYLYIRLCINAEVILGIHINHIVFLTLETTKGNIIHVSHKFHMAEPRKIFLRGCRVSLFG